MEFTGKTVKEAVGEGLATLGILEENAEIVIKEEPVKGLFGKMKGKAVVEITEKAKKYDEEVVFLKKILEFLQIPAQIEKTAEGEKEILTLVTDSSSNVIGYRGEVLDAIQTLTGAVANIGNKVYKKVVVDCENYRDRREDTLVKLAKKLEQKATEMRRAVQLEPMSPFERRIIHTALADSTTVKTTSEGKEPNRFVVIVPNDIDEYSKPYNAGANRNKSQFGGRDSRGGRNHNGYRNGKGQRNRNHGGRSERKGSGFIESNRKSSSSFSFGTFLGNSKDKD